MSQPKLLPATNVLLPSDEWSLVYFRISPHTSVKNMSFSGNMSHKPSKAQMPVWNTGSGDGTEFSKWDYRGEMIGTQWEDFVNDCAPLIQQARYQTLSAEQAVIQLFADELVQQANFNNVIGTVVRNETGDRIYFEDVEDLRGKVEGEYWDSKVKNWVPLND